MLALQVDVNNSELLEQHMFCASAEIPVTHEEDGQYFGPSLCTAVMLLPLGQPVIIQSVNPPQRCACFPG